MLLVARWEDSDGEKSKARANGWGRTFDLFLFETGEFTFLLGNLNQLSLKLAGTALSASNCSLSEPAGLGGKLGPRMVAFRGVKITSGPFA